ncbi:MAG: alpha/beta fold hydrolase [Oligoflexales bacterium]|nr:alpha/beta fold hydrolase [Oligoflexales bacterium]
MNNESTDLQIENLVDGTLYSRAHRIKVPLKHNNSSAPSSSVEQIEIYIKELSNEPFTQKKPLLLYLPGGPGFPPPRPFENASWIKQAIKKYHIVLMDPRGTGMSTPWNGAKLSALYPNTELLADYLKCFRADNIIRDAELVRSELFGEKTKWSVIGQSFGGFCLMNYLSFYPEHLDEVFITGGLPPFDIEIEDVYVTLFNKMIENNKQFFLQNPSSETLMKKLVNSLKDKPLQLRDGVLSADRLSHLGLYLGMEVTPPKVLQLLETLDYYIERQLNDFIDKKSFDLLYTFDDHPIYYVLQEAIYCENRSSNWAATRVLKELQQKHDWLDHYFWAEMIFPWMPRDYAALKPYEAATDLLAKYKWPILYDKQALSKNKVPVKAWVYKNDLYVDYKYSLNSARKIGNIQLFESETFAHDALRVHSETVFKAFLKS